jgi:hypothetical protein
VYKLYHPEVMMIDTVTLRDRGELPAEILAKRTYSSLSRRSFNIGDPRHYREMSIQASVLFPYKSTLIERFVTGQCNDINHLIRGTLFVLEVQPYAWKASLGSQAEIDEPLL